jgi:hypothetical protein
VRFADYTFGSIVVDGTTYDHDLVVDGGRIRKRHKGPSKPLRGRYGHTPLSADEDIPWTCRRLIIGSGADGRLPVMKEVLEEAERRGVEVEVHPTAEAIEELNASPVDTNAILHLTC